MMSVNNQYFSIIFFIIGSGEVIAPSLSKNIVEYKIKLFWDKSVKLSVQGATL